MSSIVRGVRRFTLLLACVSAGALAQSRAELPPGAVVQPLDTGPGAELRRNLTTLAANPQSMAALTGAGRAALAMGDAEAAYSFFERAAQVEPTSARAKAGMASALVALERARDAVALFDEAVRLGAPEAEIAGDRGLAHDLIGEQGRAQADYHLALRREDDPEIRRRLALSLAISGRREEALRTIDAQLRAHNRAAWRTQAFVLALTGDSRGAERTARGAIAPGAAEEMAPFLRRLAGLSPSQKAHAVHLGHFPGAGSQPTALAQNEPVPEPPRPQPLAPPVEQERERARPGFTYPADRIASLIPRPRRDEPLAEPPRPMVEAPAPPPQSEPPPAAAEPAPAQQSPPEPQPEPPPPAAEAPATTIADAAGAGFTLTPGDATPEPAPSPPPEASPPQASPSEPPPAAPPPAAPARSRLEGIAELVQSLPTDEARLPARAEARPARQSPSRVWVQLAHAARPGPLAGEYADVRAKASALLGSRTPYVTLANRTNLLLIGPFDTRSAAQAFVRRLAALDVAALVWTSPAGQEIERLRVPNAASSSSTRRAEANERAPARASRGRSEPEPRPAARRARARD